MTAPLEFWFDYGSPFGYFAAVKIDDLAAKFGRDVLWRPFNVRKVASAAGIDRPMVQFPIKGDYYIHDIPRMARLYGTTPWNPAHIATFNPGPPRRAFYWIEPQDAAKAKQFTLEIYHRLFCDGVAVDDGVILNEINALGLDAEVAAGLINGDELKALVDQRSDEAIAKGVFGSPMIFVDKEPFFGADRLWMVEKWLAEGGF